MQIFSIIAADIESALGRFGRDSMTDQHRMEFLMESVSSTIVFKNEEGYFKDVCDWSGVTCDEHSVVTGIDWRIYPLFRGGTIDLSFLPEKLTEFGLKRQRMHGRLPAADMPGEMRRLVLADNLFAGEVEWEFLPGTLEEMLLDENFFSGSVDLAHMPAALVSLGLSSNRFSGSIDITELPRGLARLYLNDNKLSQPRITVANIPQAAECYIFTDNKLGEVVHADGEPNPFVHFD